ncbi:hypothetical protein Trydic_g5464 [Trypoxylus dichotomus]
MKCGEGHSIHLCTKPKTAPPKFANCQGKHLSTYIKCPANPNNTAINKKFIDASRPKVNPWTKKRETTAMKNETEKQPTKEDPINDSGESEEKLALILGRMVLNFNSTNATTEQRLAFLQQTEELTKLYKTKTDQNTKPGGGTAILVRKEIKHYSIGTNTATMETTAVHIHTKRGIIALYAAYSSPHDNIKEADIDAVFNSHQPTILAGDLNSKHPQWNAKTLNHAPTEDIHIHTPTGSTDVLDLVILKNVTTPYYLETINDLSSDHLPVIVTVSIESSNIQQTIRVTNWQKFEKSLKLRPTYISTDNNIDTAILLNNITNEIEKDLAENYNDQCDAKIENINDDDTGLWKITKILKTKKEKIPPILGTRAIINNNSDKTEEFANYLEGTFRPNPPMGRDHEKFTDVTNKQVHTEYRDTINVQETTTEKLWNIIKTLADRKVPGHRISNTAIKHLTLEAFCTLVIMWKRCSKALLCLEKVYLLKGSTKISTYQQIRTTFILRRKTPPQLHKKGGSSKRLKSKHYVYDLVQDTDTVRQPNIDIILTEFIKAVGNKGEKISMKPNFAYNQLLLPGLGVYATPENLEKYKEESTSKIQYSSRSAQMMVSILSNKTISVVMNKEIPWSLKPWHITTSFRKCGYHVPENAVTMPTKPIEGPNMDIENKEFFVIVTINNNEKVQVRCRIHHWSTSVIHRIPYEYEFWKKPTKPIFSSEEDKNT